MASAIGALRAELSASAAAFERDMGRARRAVQSEGNAMQRAFGNASQAGTRLVSSIFNVRNAAIAAAGAAGLMALSRRAIETASAMGDTADRLGVSVEALQELRYAAQQGGMGISNFDTALRRFIRRSSEAAQGTGAAKDAFKELGISLRDNEGRLKASEDLLGEVADALQRVPEQADRLRLAFRLFDTDGAQMLNVLSRGSDGLRDLREEARQLGVVISEDMIRRSQQASGELSTMGDVLRVAGTNMALEFMPVMRELAQLFVSGEFQRGVRSASEEIRRMVQWMVDNSDLIMRVTGALAGMRIGRMAGPKGMIAGGIGGAFLPEMLRSEVDQLQGNLKELRGMIDERRNLMRELGEDDDSKRLIERWEREQSNIIARLYEISEERRQAGQGGEAPTARTPDPVDMSGLENFDGGSTRATGRDAAAQAAERERQAVDDLLASLKFERDQLGRTALEQQKANALRRAGAAATPEQRREIEQIVEAIHQETEALEENRRAQEQRAQAIDHLFRMGGDALSRIVDSSEKASDAIKRLGVELALAAAQAALLGTGPLAGLFSGIGGIGTSASFTQNGNWAAANAGFPGFYRGGSFTVGGAGGLDSQVAAMRVTPGEVVSVNKPGQEKGDVTFAPVINIDAKNAQQGVKAEIEAAMRAMMQEFEPNVVNALRNIHRKGTEI